MGVLNKTLDIFGIEGVDWYSDPKRWPYILTIVHVWKTIGYGSIVYYAGLMGINKELYEAAAIDGAGKLRQARHISIPSLTPLITVLVILSIGGFFRGDFGMFYNIPRNLGALYSTTDIIDTYIYRALTQIGDIGMASAIGFFQSITGLILVVFSNLLIRKISPDNSLF
jgi:putative aldouronate transport system permease protein